MKKTFQLENLDCAHCAAKMEESIHKLEHVISCSISFMTQKLTIDIEEESFYDTMKLVQKAIHKVDPDCTIKM